MRRFKNLEIGGIESKIFNLILLTEGLYFGMSDGTWGLYPEGWQDSWYWVFTRLEHIARDNEEAAVSIRVWMDGLQDQICSSGKTGNPVAETVCQSVRELLEELETETK